MKKLFTPFYWIVFICVIFTICVSIILSLFISNKLLISISLCILIVLLNIWEIVDFTDIYCVLWCRRNWIQNCRQSILSYCESTNSFISCEKYNAKPNEFKMKDYNQAHLEWYDTGVFTQTPKWLDFSFEFEYKGRRFIACRNKGAIYDDYQLDDIEKWCTEWLQENVDNRITGVEISTHDILNYLSATKTGYNHVISKNETYDFLINYKENETKVFYYYDINGSTFYGVDENLGK